MKLGRGMGSGKRWPYKIITKIAAGALEKGEKYQPYYPRLVNLVEISLEWWKMMFHKISASGSN